MWERKCECGRGSVSVGEEMKCYTGWGYCIPLGVVQRAKDARVADVVGVRKSVQLDLHDQKRDQITVHDWKTTNSTEKKILEKYISFLRFILLFFSSFIDSVAFCILFRGMGGKNGKLEAKTIFLS